MGYRDDFIDLKNVTRNQLRILTGIEMFYGNFDDLKYIYASKEIKELGEYIKKINELNTLKQKMTSITATQGLKALDKSLDRARKIGSEITTLKNKLLEKIGKLNEYKITEEDLEDMYSGQ